MVVVVDICRNSDGAVTSRISLTIQDGLQFLDEHEEEVLLGYLLQSSSLHDEICGRHER